MWILTIIALSASSSSTQSSLTACERSFELINVNGVQQAFCQSPFSGDRVWIIKDGKRLVEPGAFLP